MKSKIKKISLIATFMVIGFIIGIAMPIIINAEGNDANVAQVLETKRFTSSLVAAGTKGAMKDFSGELITKNVEATNDDFIETISLTPGYYDQIQVNTEAVYNAGYEAGQEDGDDFSSLQYENYTAENIKSGTTINVKDGDGNVLKSVTGSYAGDTTHSVIVKTRGNGSDKVQLAVYVDGVCKYDTGYIDRANFTTYAGSGWSFTSSSITV